MIDTFCGSRQNNEQNTSSTIPSQSLSASWVCGINSGQNIGLSLGTMSKRQKIEIALQNALPTLCKILLAVLVVGAFVLLGVWLSRHYPAFWHMLFPRLAIGVIVGAIVGALWGSLIGLIASR